MQKIDLQVEVNEFKDSQYKSNLNELEGFVDCKGRPARKDRHGGKRSALFVYVMTGLDNLAYNGTAINLVQYFTIFMNMEIAKAATTLTNFMGTTFLLTLVGGVISDSFLSRLKTSVLSALIQLTGYLVLLIQAHYGSLKHPQCNLLDPTSVCVRVNGMKSAMLFVGLYLIAIGNGCSKASVTSLGEDQFDERDPHERENLCNFFNMYYLSFTIVSTVGVTVLVWIQNKEGWDVAFGYSAGAIFLATALIMLGVTTYRNKILQGSRLTRVL